MNTVQYKCLNCGGELTFDPDKQEFSCPYCLSTFTETEVENHFQEQNRQAATQADTNAQTLQSDTDPAAFEAQARFYECPSCGAQIIAEETTSATFCYYCHTPVVLAGRLTNQYAPSHVLPFSVSRKKAESIFRAWCKKRWFLPSNFKSKKQLEKMSGVYVPFWLASGDADATLKGLGKSIKTWSDVNREYTETSTYEVFRQATISFERVPADGSKKIDDELMAAIEPFHYEEMRSFAMQYLSGFQAEKYDVEWADALPRIKNRMHIASEKILDGTTGQYETVEDKQVNVQLKDVHHNYVLLPIWFMNYKYNGKLYYFVVNGQTEKIAGTPPLSLPKLLIFCAILMLIIGLLGGLIGGVL